MPTSIAPMKFLPAHTVKFSVMEHCKRNNYVFVHPWPRAFVQRYGLAVPRDSNHVAIRVPNFGRRVRVPEESRHDVAFSLTLVVIGTFGVGPSDGTGGFEALVGDEGAWGSE